MANKKSEHYDDETRCAIEFYAKGSMPSAAALKQAPQIDDWYPVFRDGDETRRVVDLCGAVFSRAHPGRIRCYTGPLLWIDRKLRFAYSSSGTLYRLLKRR